MNTKAVFYGALSAVLVFAVLNWREPMQATRAAALATPAARRFELVQLHPSAAIEWSGVLDSQTGCVWLLKSDDANRAAPLSRSSFYTQTDYAHVVGPQFFSLVNYDAGDYVAPMNSKGVLNFSAAADEVVRIANLCSESRIQALQSSAAGR